MMTKTENAPCPGTKSKVLVIDDDRNLLKLLGMVLRKSGFEVTQASTGQQALDFLLNDNFDAVLSDVDLPDMTCWEVCRRLKQDRNRQKTAVIMMSGRHGEDMEKMLLEAGAADFITKPFSAAIAVTKVIGLIRKQKI